MLKTHYNCLRWDQGCSQYIIDMDNIKGVQVLRPAPPIATHQVHIHMGEGVTYTMTGEYAEAFADWYWRTNGEGGYKVPDLDLP